MTGAEVANHLYTMAMKHVGKSNTLYRIFYYDCLPIDKKVHNPVSKKLFDFSKTDEYKFRTELEHVDGITSLGPFNNRKKKS